MQSCRFSGTIPPIVQVLAKGLMVSDTAIFIIAGSIVVIVFVVLYRHFRRVRVKMRGPGGMGVELEASKDPPQADGSAGGAPAPGGARIEGVKAGRDAVAHDQTGRGATVKDTEAGRDAKATAIPPEENPPPKP